MQMVVDTVAVAIELQFEGWWTKHHLLSGIVKHPRSERDVTRDVRMSYTSGGARERALTRPGAVHRCFPGHFTSKLTVVRNQPRAER